MKITDLTNDQVFRYFDIRLQGKMRQSGSGYMAQCPWHEDRHASLSISIEKKVWKCHGPCNEGGGLLDFERKFLGGDAAEALARIGELLGEKQLRLTGGKPERIYQYQDAYGRVIFEKLRYPGKKFVQRKVIDAKKGEYEYKLTGITNKPLYHLPEVLTSDQVFVAEGCKDADNIRAAFPWSEKTRVTATTNFDGAGKWRDEYGPYFTGKRVVVVSDNDEVGEKHAEMVARSVHRYAAGVKVIFFRELPPKADVSDFLADHTPAELIARVHATPIWRPPEQDKSYFMVSEEFAKMAPPKIDWIIPNIIQRGVNGLMIARPKGAKSMTVLDLAIALCSGDPWLESNVNSICRVGLLSREDWPLSTSWRLSRLCEGRGIHPGDLNQYLYINTKLQVPKLLIDDDSDLQELMRQIEARNLEFLIFDVFRAMHSAEENDNTEMQKIIERFNSIKSKTGAQILIVHHTRKGEAPSLTEQARGAGAIAGWAEYVIGLSVEDEEAKPSTIRQIGFEVKAGNTPKTRYFRIVDKHRDECSIPDDCACPRRLEVDHEYQPPHKGGR